MKFVVKKRVPSLNMWYSGMHWSKRAGMKKEWMRYFGELYLTIDNFKLKEYALTVNYNSDLDADNIIPLIKMFNDWMQKVMIVPNDNTTYFKGFTVLFDDLLDKDTYKIEIVS